VEIEQVAEPAELITERRRDMQHNDYFPVAGRIHDRHRHIQPAERDHTHFVAHVQRCWCVVGLDTPATERHPQL
jgi:hypothetical protein